MDSKYLAELSTQIGTEWHLLGVYLGFTVAQMEQLRAAYPNSISQGVTVMLYQWNTILEQHGKQTVTILADALRDTGRADLADDLCTSFQRLSVESPNCHRRIKPENTFDVDELDGYSGSDCQQNRDGDYREHLQKVKFENCTSDPLYKYLEQSKAFMEHKLKARGSFVKTRAFDRALECLTENGIVAVIGNAGDGKTTIAINLLRHLQQQGHLVLVFSDPNLLEQALDPDRKIVYFVDDAFGTPSLNRRLVEIWVRLYDKIDSLVSTRKISLVLTSRKIVLLKAKSMICACDRYGNSLIDITDKSLCLTNTERRMLISSHCQGYNVLSMESSEYTPGFPLLCKLYATNKRFQIVKDFFDSPLLLLQKDICDLLNHDTPAFCIMVLMVLHDGKLPVQYLDVFEEDCMDEIKLETVVKAYGLDRMTAISKMESAVETIKGVYVEEEDDMYVFMHDSIFDAVCLVFGQKHPRRVLQITSSEFIELRVRTSNVDDQTLDVIVLKKPQFKHLSKRWIDDIIKGKIQCIFNNPSIHDKEMMNNFIDTIEKITASEFEEFVLSFDGQKSLIEFVFEEGHSKLASNLLRKIKCTEKLSDYEIPIKCLLTSIEQRDVTLVRLLLDYGINTESCTRPFKTTSVHVAARVGDVEILRMILEKNRNKSLFKKDIFGLEPIHYSSQNSNSLCLELLISNGGAVNNMDLEGKQPIHYASYEGSEECVKILQNAGADVNAITCNSLGRTPLHYAAMSNNFEIVCYLLSQNCDPNVYDEDHSTPLFYACKNGRWRTVKALIHGGADTNVRNEYNKLPIHAAAEGSHSDNSAAYACLKILLGGHTDVNAVDDQGKSALHYSCAWSYDHRYDSVQLLVELEADVNIQDGFKMTPLMYACNSGSYKCAALLVQNGADPNCVGSRKIQPIHLASADGNIEIVKFLISKSVDIKAQNEDGRQPIHFSSQYGNDDVVCLLVWKGADVNAKDNTGKEPLHYACKWARTKTIKLLIKLGGNPYNKDNEGSLPKDLIPQWTSNSKYIEKCLSTSSNSL